MIIGLDASGRFEAVLGDDFGASAVAAAVIPESAAVEIARWTEQALPRWGREDVGELHAAPLNWDQRLEICRMLGERNDVRVEVAVTSAIALGSPGAITAHRARQLAKAREAKLRARTPDGQKRSDVAIRMLEGRRRGRTKLSDRDYVLVAMLPPAISGAVQKAFTFFSADEWRDSMSSLRVVVDDETGAAMRYTPNVLMPFLSDERFRLVTPAHWLAEPQHPLYKRALHVDGDGYDLIELLGSDVAWRSSAAEPAIQVADLAAWVVCRTLNRPHETVARECYELIRPILVGGGGHCFGTFAIGSGERAWLPFHAHLHSKAEPPEWMTPVGDAAELASVRSRSSAARRL